jgi:hypothetical protein
LLFEVLISQNFSPAGSSHHFVSLAKNLGLEICERSEQATLNKKSTRRKFSIYPNPIAYSSLIFLPSANRVVRKKIIQKLEKSKLNDNKKSMIISQQEFCHD